jgi:simple sugar transport system ATP-binding protein
MKDGTVLSACGISKRFSGVRALSDVKLEIEVGEIRGLVGENGSGKSTLIKILAGALAADQGSIRLGDKDYSRLRPIDAIREGIQVIYQDFSLFPNLSVAENIALNDEMARGRFWVDWNRVTRVATEALERLQVQMDLGSPVESLTVANRQLVAISRALVQGARLIVMDEPTTALTQKEVKSLFEVITRLKGENVSVLFVSHKLPEVREICDTITVLRNGLKVAEGPVEGFETSDLVKLITGREIQKPASSLAGKHNGSPVTLKVEHLGKEGFFQDVSFDLYRGEVLGITGLLGSGRTAVGWSLFGLLPWDKGQVFLGDEKVVIRSVQQAIRNGIAYVPEDRLTQGLFVEHSVSRNLLISVLNRLADKWGIISRIRAGRLVQECVQLLRIQIPSVDSPVQTLSGGNQQRVVVGRWLATEPRLLILNSPTAGVDVGSKYEIHRKIREMAESGTGVILISDDIPELLENCYRVVVMRRGEVAGTYAVSNLDEQVLSQKLTA